MKPSIVEPAITQLVAEGRSMVADLRAAEEACRKVEKKLIETREAAQMRRLELGALLLKVRGMYPRRGTAEAGWKAYLESIEVDDSTAHRYMEMARNPAPATSHDPSVRRSEGEIGPDAPPPTDSDAPAELLDQGGAANLHGRNAPDGDEYCTPKWIADALGRWDLDPCSNDRSHIDSAKCFRLDKGQDGLELAMGVDAKTKTFINPPYSDVMPWVIAFAHVRFCFLLKFDPSTKWFAELIENSELVLIPDGTRIPEGTRIAFDPPPGKEAGAVAFPHAFFFAKAKDAPKALLDVCYRWNVE